MFALLCNTPPADGGDRHIDGNHAFPVNQPFGLTVEVSDAISPPGGDLPQDSFMSIWIDDTGYRLPPVQAGPYGAWMGEMPMDDRIIGLLYDAGTVMVDTGYGPRWTYGTTGLTAALDTALGHCIEGWTLWGETIPTSLSRYWPAVDEGPAAPVPPAQTIILPPPDTPRPPPQKRTP